MFRLTTRNLLRQLTGNHNPSAHLQTAARPSAAPKAYATPDIVINHTLAGTYVKAANTELLNIYAEHTGLKKTKEGSLHIPNSPEEAPAASLLARLLHHDGYSAAAKDLQVIVEGLEEKEIAELGEAAEIRSKLSK